MTTTDQCGCTIQPLPPKRWVQDQIQVAILFCPLHSAAPALYEQASFAVANGDKWTLEDWQNWRTNHARAVVELAEKGEQG